MTGRQISPEAQQAADFVAQVLRGNATPRDVAGAPPRTHDFDIGVDDTLIVLEITAARNRDVVRQAAQAFKHEWHAADVIQTATKIMNVLEDRP